MDKIGARKAAYTYVRNFVTGYTCVAGVKPDPSDAGLAHALGAMSIADELHALKKGEIDPSRRLVDACRKLNNGAVLLEGEIETYLVSPFTQE